jgi:hypothetical protein
MLHSFLLQCPVLCSSFGILNRTQYPETAPASIFRWVWVLLCLVLMEQLFQIILLEKGKDS